MNCARPARRAHDVSGDSGRAYTGRLEFVAQSACRPYQLRRDTSGRKVEKPGGFRLSLLLSIAIALHKTYWRRRAHECTS